MRESDPTLCAAMRVLKDAADRDYECEIDRITAVLGMPRPTVSAIMDQASATAFHVLWFGRMPDPLPERR